MKQKLIVLAMLNLGACCLNSSISTAFAQADEVEGKRIDNARVDQQAWPAPAGWNRLWPILAVGCYAPRCRDHESGGCTSTGNASGFIRKEFAENATGALAGAVPSPGFPD